MSDMFKISLPDGSVREMAVGSTPADVAAAIGPGLAKAALAARVNGDLVDLSRPFAGDAQLALITSRDEAEALRIANGTAYGLSSAVCTNRLDYITRFISELHVGSVNVREVPGYRLELTPFGGIKDSGLGYKEGVQEAMKSFCNTKTYSLPW